MKCTLTVCGCVIALSSLCIGQSGRDKAPLSSLVDSERKFAGTSVEKGARPSFMMFFADDAIVFRPHPVKYKEAMKHVPAPQNPLEATLNWEPIYADISLSGELGYTTGPSEWTDHSAAKRPPYYGFYFSFWKKQPSGDWKVVFDIGTELPGPYSGSRAFRSPEKVELRKDMGSVGVEAQRSSLMKTEREFLGSARSEGALKALDKFLSGEPRVYRQKEYPIVGNDAIHAYFSRKPYLSTWEPIQSDVAISGDLGYVYGSYVVKTGDAKPVDEEKGYYLRAWKRDARNQWKLVAEVTNPLPPETRKTKQ
jgi:ketosteroid isomerase-like protein